MLRCVYTDLDGTLLGPGASLFRDADGGFTLLPARALEACHRAGVEVVIKSGRRRAQVMEDAELATGIEVFNLEGAGGTVGLQRLVRSVQDLADAVPTARPTVVVTKLRSGSVGPSPRRQVTTTLARYAGIHDPVLLPDDRGAYDAALLAGRALPEHAPSSPLR